MEDIFTTAAESLPIEQIEQIEPSDLTVSNFKKILDAILPGVRSLAFNIVICILIYVIGSKVIALIKRMLTRALNRMQAESGLSHFLESAIDIVLHIFLIFMILGQLGVNTASIVTVLGTLMLAVGMSLQGSLSNVAGGILILLMHPHAHDKGQPCPDDPQRPDLQLRCHGLWREPCETSRSHRGDQL